MIEKVGIDELMKIIGALYVENVVLKSKLSIKNHNETKNESGNASEITK